MTGPLMKSLPANPESDYGQQMIDPDRPIEDAEAPAGFSIKKVWPLIVLVAGLGLFFALGLDQYVTFDALRDNRETLLSLVADHRVLSILLFTLAYIAVAAFSLPGGAIMSITGGFLFGLYFGTIAIVVGATIGASILFIAAKTAFGDALRAKIGDGKVIAKMERGFRENAFNYMLVLRLVPLFPFFVVNLVPAFLGVPLRTYVIATFVGIIPGAAVFASVGNGLGAIFDQGETPDLGIIFQPQILGPILGLALLALIPVIYEKFFKKAPTSTGG